MLPNLESSEGSRSGDGRSASGRLGRRGEEVVVVGRSPTAHRHVLVGRSPHRHVLVGRSHTARLHLVLALCGCVEALVTVTPCSVTAASRVLDTLPLLLARPSLVRLPPLALLLACG
jgi:NAD(P)-dependent dehydrogenase (short-subunit alcohol dehydrogenase family)